MTNNKFTTALGRARDRFVSYIEGAYGNVHLGDELITALGIVGRVIYTVLAVILDIIITILLICGITGIIVVTAFAIYVKNYIDPVFDDKHPSAVHVSVNLHAH